MRLPWSNNPKLGEGQDPWERPPSVLEAWRGNTKEKPSVTPGFTQNTRWLVTPAWGIHGLCWTEGYYSNCKIQSSSTTLILTQPLTKTAWQCKRYVHSRSKFSLPQSWLFIDHYDLLHLIKKLQDMQKKKEKKNDLPREKVAHRTRPRNG